jgi:hypothetical protein
MSNILSPLPLNDNTVKNFDDPSIQHYLQNVKDHNYPLYPRMLKDEYNSLFNKSPLYPSDGWQQRNRHVWTDEMIEDLYKEYFPLETEQKSSEPVSVFLLLVEYDSRNASTWKRTSPDPVDLWHIGRIIKIGAQAFASNKFTLGATATYGDWVRFNPLDAIRAKFTISENFPILLPDTAILELIEDPTRFVN